ncbi:MAG TPA: YciI family protein [Candidatus Limnocylindrales bacterium]|nr:YciI family protein [Candidatus Limnocylindrales bacterium]
MTDPTDPHAASDPGPIEPVWLVEGTYAPDAAETRGPYRAEHLARLRRLKADGIVVEAGAFADVSSSIVIVRAPDEQAAIDLVRDDVYVRNGVWVEVRARAFGRVRDG